MKRWVRVKIIGTGTYEDPRRADVNASHSMIELNEEECIAKVADLPEKISTLTALTDDEALNLIKSKIPTAELYDVDVVDPEVEVIAKQLGFDPAKIRADALVKGSAVLQEQENYLMTQICERIGLTRPFWDVEAQKSNRWIRGKDIEIDIKSGRSDAHEFVLSRIRSKIKNIMSLSTN